MKCPVHDRRVADELWWAVKPIPPVREIWWAIKFRFVSQGKRDCKVSIPLTDSSYSLQIQWGDDQPRSFNGAENPNGHGQQKAAWNTRTLRKTANRGGDKISRTSTPVAETITNKINAHHARIASRSGLASLHAARIDRDLAEEAYEKFLPKFVTPEDAEEHDAWMNIGSIRLNWCKLI